MTKRTRNVIFVMAVFLVAGFSVGAFAKDKDKDHKKSKHEHHAKHDTSHGKDHTKHETDHSKDHAKDLSKPEMVVSDKVPFAIDSGDRVIIKDYLRDSYGKFCPPGLAKKGNGCMPPGQAKKRYIIGEPLGVDWEPVPDNLLGHLHAPNGCRYVMVDKDILLIGEASKKVIDAITLLSTVD